MVCLLYHRYSLNAIIKELTLETIPSRYEDEIDLLELTKIIWDGKLWIIIATLLSIGLGATYTAIVPTIYEVEVNAKVHANANANGKLLRLVTQNANFDWSVKRKTQTLALETRKPEDLSVYSKDLENALSATTSQIIKSKKNELEQISKLSPAFLGTETVASAVLENQRFIYFFETIGLEQIEFSGPKTKIKSPKTHLVVVLAFVLGGMIGVLGVLIRSAYRNRIKNQ